MVVWLGAAHLAPRLDVSHSSSDRSGAAVLSMTATDLLFVLHVHWTHRGGGGGAPGLKAAVTQHCSAKPTRGPGDSYRVAAVIKQTSGGSLTETVMMLQ